MDRFKVKAALSLAAAFGVLGVAGAHAGESREASDAGAAAPPGAATGARAGTTDPCTPESERARVVQVTYERWYGGNVLGANARRTDRLRMSTRYRGRRAAAPLRSRNGFEWKPIKKEGGKRLFRLVRKALEGERGFARVRTFAKGDCGRIDRHRWTFRYSECSVSTDPSYPIYCELSRND